MKQIQILFYVLLFSVIGLNQLLGQEKKHSLILSGVLAHYSNVGYTPDYFNGYYFFPVNPGIEAIYMFSISPHFKLGTGINLQTGRNMSWKRDLRRFHYKEVSIPLQARVDLFRFFKKSMSWFFTIGYNPGISFNIKAESPDSFEYWNEIKLSASSIQNYSDDNFFTDLYFDLGFTQSIGRFGEFSISPFVDFRQNSTWMDYHKDKHHYGIKISYPLKF
jgi:hypothetical protein